jgi:hypothetical protein
MILTIFLALGTAAEVNLQSLAEEVTCPVPEETDGAGFAF